MNILTFLASFADTSFARLFTEMTPIAIVLFVLGIIFSAIEMFVPGFGFFGISGVCMVVAGIVVRLVSGGDAMMFVYMVLISLVLFFIMFFVISHAITKGRLSKSKIFNIGTAVPEDKTEGTKDFSMYLNQEGTSTTALHPVGKAKFGNAVVDVVAQEGFVEEGVEIICVEVEGQRVVVVRK